MRKRGGFDHNFENNLLWNWLTLVLAAWLWWPYAAWWIIVLVFVALTLASLDKYTGQYICLVASSILFGIGVSIRFLTF